MTILSLELFNEAQALLNGSPLRFLSCNNKLSHSCRAEANRVCVSASLVTFEMLSQSDFQGLDLAGDMHNMIQVISDHAIELHDFELELKQTVLAHCRFGFFF